ncbi:MAG: SpaH/EbpB family LPXTG-anchored major pilin [Carnobacterium sp.]|nr:SpaH/EbpB family LPXTG-anchored major pilin [Carnobacterium sp.]
MSKKMVSRSMTLLLVAILAVLGLGKTMVQAVAPAGPLTNVIITKVQTIDQAKDMTIDQLEKGVTISDYFSDGSKVLPGVSFTYFSVSEAQLATMTGNPIGFDTVGEVEAVVGAGIATAETDSNGQVTLPNLTEGFYWIVENTKGTIASSTAVPFGLTLPFTNKAGNGYLETIYVYPKNTLQDADPEVEKDVEESNVAIGDINTWKVSLEIPVGIEDYDQFSFYDDIDSRLTFVGEATVEATATGITLIKGTDYTVNYASPRLNVVFTEAGREKLTDATSAKVEVSFQTKVNDTAIMGQEIENSATIEFDNGFGTVGENVPEELPEVHTGGKAFVKQDEKVTNTKLAGAEFKIKNTTGQYVKVVAGAVTFGSEADATLFTSDVAGKFEVKGLPYADYVLVETKAPTGYALPTNPETGFTVSAGSYYTNPTEIQASTVASNNAQNINNRKLTIPQTGGFGTLAFTVIGAILMLTSILFYKRTGKKA